MNVAHAGFELKGVLKGKAGRTPGAKIKTVMSDVSRSNQTLVLKVGPHNNNAGVRDVLGHNGARLLVITRRNVLDLLVCNVKDCFDPSRTGNEWGYPVNATTGERDSLCFEARHLPSGSLQPKVVLHTNNLSASLDFYDSQLNKTLSWWAGGGFASDEVPHVTLEDLSAYEYNMTDTLGDDAPANSSGSRYLSVSDVSLTAWANVLLAFGVEPNRTTIAAYLLPSAARIPPHSAGDEIYNLKDVSRMLTKLNRTDLLTATQGGRVMSVIQGI